MTKLIKLKLVLMGLAFLLLLPTINIAFGIWVFNKAFNEADQLQTELSNMHRALEAGSFTCSPYKDGESIAVGELKKLFVGLVRKGGDILRAGFSEDQDYGLIAFYHILKVDIKYTETVNTLSDLAVDSRKLYYDFNRVDSELCPTEDIHSLTINDKKLNLYIKETLHGVQELEYRLGKLLDDYKKMRPYALAIMWFAILFEVVGYAIAVCFIIEAYINPATNYANYAA